MNEAEFTRRWNKYFNKVRRPDTTDELMEMVKQQHFPRTQWKYNQIIGYIEVCVSKIDVIFYIYKTRDNRFIATSSSKHFIQYESTNGLHFRHVQMSNEEIIYQIIHYVEAIEKKLSGKQLVDKTSFNNCIKYLDINAIIKSI